MTYTTLPTSNQRHCSFRNSRNRICRPHLLYMHHSPQKTLFLTLLTKCPCGYWFEWRCSHAGTGSTYSSCNNTQTHQQHTALLERERERDRCWPPTASRDVPHKLHKDSKALASAVEACTDLRLPWLNRERGSCFIHGQKENTKGGVPLHEGGGSTATPANRHLPEQGNWRREGPRLRGVVAKEPHCNPAHIDTHINTQTNSSISASSFTLWLLNTAVLARDKDCQAALNSVYQNEKQSRSLF